MFYLHILMVVHVRNSAYYYPIFLLTLITRTG